MFFLLTEALVPLLLTIVLLLAWWFIPHYNRWRLYRAIPMPRYIPCHWLLGHLPSIVKRNEALALSFVKEVNEPGPQPTTLLRLYLGPLITVSIVHSKYVGAFLKEPKSDFYNMLLPWLGEGLLISEGKKWFRNRRLLTPAFHYSILKNYLSIYNSCVSKLLHHWHKAAREGKLVNVFENLSSLSLDIILQCAFSFKSDCQEDKTQHPYVRACGALVQHVSDRSLNPFYGIDWIYWLTPHGRKMKKLCKIVHEHAEGVIAERKEKLLAEDEGSGCNTSRKCYDFLDTLILARDEDGLGMSDLEIRNEVDTFMFEGHDTTTSGMSWTLYCLAQHPQHQEKIREEVRSVLKDRECLEYEDLKHLNYTTWCIKEAMRLYPPVFEFFRQPAEDVQVGGYVVPKGTTVSISTYLIHHNSEIWKNPMEYNPLRFMPSNMENQGPYDYLPFSAGSRNCIGQNFAMNEMKVVIGSVINHLELALDDQHYVDMLPTIIMRTRSDIKLHLQEV